MRHLKPLRQVYNCPWLAIRNARSVARQKATLDIIEKELSSQHYRDVAAIFSTLRRTNAFASLNAPVEADKLKRTAVLDHLNHYEVISIGIRQNILDQRIYRAWMEGTFVRDWNAASNWVQRERWKIGKDGKWQYRASIFANFQEVACRWSTEAVRLTATSAPPPTKTTGPGDDPLPLPINEVSLKN